MPTPTNNLQLNTFLENEAVDFEAINANFEKIDEFCIAVESGTKTAAYSGAVSGNAVWTYKKYSDGTLEMYTKLSFNGACTGGTGPYYMSHIKAMFPLSLKAVDDVQLNLRSSSNKGWVSDTTDKNILDYVQFTPVSPVSELASNYKEVYINVKGRWK